MSFFSIFLSQVQFSLKFFWTLVCTLKFYITQSLFTSIGKCIYARTCIYMYLVVIYGLHSTFTKFKKSRETLSFDTFTRLMLFCLYCFFLFLVLIFFFVFNLEPASSSSSSTPHDGRCLQDGSSPQYLQCCQPSLQFPVDCFYKFLCT